VHSIASAQPIDKLDVVQKDWQTGKPLPVPAFPAFQSILTRPITGQGFPQNRYTHIIESVRNYRRATELAPQDGLYLLGLGWMLEQGSNNAVDIGPPPGYPNGRATREYWISQALAAYRKSYSQAEVSDLQQNGFNHSFMDNAVSVEAGEGILRMLSSKR